MKRILIIGSILFVSTMLWAQSKQDTAEKSPLKAELKAWVLRSDTVDGKVVTKKLPADSAVNGDTIQYELIYTNLSDKPISGLEPMALIPDGTEYVVGSAFSSAKARVLFSIDGGKSFHELPIYYTVTLPDGKKVKKEATPDMFTHIRWGMEGELRPGHSAVFSYKVVVK